MQLTEHQNTLTSEPNREACFTRVKTFILASASFGVKVSSPRKSYPIAERTNHECAGRCRLPLESAHDPTRWALEIGIPFAARETRGAWLIHGRTTGATEHVCYNDAVCKSAGRSLPAKPPGLLRHLGRRTGERKVRAPQDAVVGNTHRPSVVFASSDNRRSQATRTRIGKVQQKAYRLSS